MQDFLLFFDDIVERHQRLHLYIGYNKVCDWAIRIEHRLQTGTVTVCDIQECNMTLAFAKAHVALKEYLSENFGGF